jgi:hypothetical protein
LEKQFRQRNRYYKKLLNTRQLQKFEELTLLFDEQKVYINSEEFPLSINCLDLPMEVEKFKEGIIWTVRVLAYDEERCELITEIINYNAKPETSVSKQTSLQFLIIDKIKFRSIDTSKLLLATVLPKSPIIEKVELTIDHKVTADPVLKKLSKTMKVPFHKLQFLPGCISFSLFIEEFNKEITFEIENLDIRPEFEVIRSYFIKILKKKLISADIEIHYNSNEIITAAASSEDIDKINSTTIDNVRFEFVKREMLTFKGNPENSSVLNTLEDLLPKEKNAMGQLFKSEQDLIDDLLKIKNSKHYYQLKYLSSQHLSSVLRIRFVLTPFSFLFLLDGTKKYHIVWETLYSEEATYIWHFEKSMDALRHGLKEIEITLQEIKATGKPDYIRKEHDNFSRILHDYTDYTNAKSGFTVWKGTLEERLV